MLCPACKTELRQTDLGEFGLVVLDMCPECEGTWFDKGELNRLDESIWVDIEDHKFHEVEGDHKEVGCPKCTTPLEPISPADAADLIIDRCQKCEGFWLDRGELDRVVQIADQEHSKLADNMVLLKKPHDWSSLRWFAHLLKCHYQKK